MFKGFLSGLFWGGMVGALVLAVLSLYAPLSSSQANVGAGVQTPAATAEPKESAALDTVPDESSDGIASEDIKVAEVKRDVAVLPETQGADHAAKLAQEELRELQLDVAEDAVEIDADEVVAAAENSVPTRQVQETSPDVIANLVIPKFQDTSETNILTLPQIGDTGVETPEVPNGISLAENKIADQPIVVSEKPIGALPVTVLKTSPTELGFSDDVAVIAPRVGDGIDEAPKTMTTALAAPVISELAPNPVENPAIVRVAVKPGTRIGRLPQIGQKIVDVNADTPIGVEVEPIENPVSADTVQIVTGRLPTVGGASGTASGQIIQASTPKVAAPASRGALLDHAATFKTNAQSLFSIVIIDIGDAGVAREQLLNSSYPITIAIDPATENAASLMSQYRAAGIEVVALLNDLPKAAAPSDVAVAVSGYFGVLDQAVAVMEPFDRRLQRNRNLLEPVLGALSDTGHGLMTYAQGLNTTQQSAKRSGVPSAGIFRVLDGEREKSAKIKRYLKRAAFNAGKNGSVVVVGRSYSETMTAILEWALENNDASLSLAPISAVLKADISQGS